MKQENTIAVAMKSGFTLVEILVVVFILGILATMAVMSLGGVSDSSSETICKSSLKTIYRSVETYKINNSNRRPQTIKDLVKKNERGLRALEEDAIVDPWGTEFKLEYKSGDWLVTSAGPDGSFGTEDDLKYPAKDSN